MLHVIQKYNNNFNILYKERDQKILGQVTEEKLNCS